MRFLLSLAALFLFSGKPVHASTSQLPPHASGLMLAEVAGVTRADMRPGDGNLTETVTLRIVKSTGCTLGSFEILVSAGGLRAPDSMPPDVKQEGSGRPAPGSFKQGERYWIAVSSAPEYGLCHAEIIGWWPDKDWPEFERVIAQDLLRKHPHYSPAADITVNFYTQSPDQIFAEAEKHGALLWSKRYKGALPAYLPLSVGPASGMGEGFEPGGIAAREMSPETQAIAITIAEDMETGNPYGVPAGRHEIQRVYELTSGLLIADSITDRYRGVYSRQTSKRVMSTRYTNTGAPGKVTLFDAATGAPLKE